MKRAELRQIIREEIRKKLNGSYANRHSILFEKHSDDSNPYNIIASKNFKSWNDLLQTGDPNEISTLYADESTFLPTMSDKFEKGKDGAKEYFKHFMEKDPVGKIIKSEVQVINKNCYLESGMYDFEVGDENKRNIVHARFTFLWKKIDNTWIILHHHSSLVPE